MQQKRELVRMAATDSRDRRGRSICHSGCECAWRGSQWAKQAGLGWVRGVAAVERMGILEGVARVGCPPDCAKELGELVLHQRRDLLFALRAGCVRRVLLRILEQGREGLVGLAAHITQEQVKRLPHAAAAVTRPPPNLGERWRNR